VPCRLGAGGLVEVVEIELTADEKAALHRSASAVNDVLEVIDSRREEIDAALPPVGQGVKVGG
jgi:malate/lactate dehydrogenase